MIQRSTFERRDCSAFAMGGGYRGFAAGAEGQRRPVCDCGGIVDQRDADARSRDVRLRGTAMGPGLRDAAHGLGWAADAVLAPVLRHVRVVRERVPWHLHGADAAGTAARVAPCPL